MTDTISIIIPIYNVEKYIIRCLDSVVKQTYHGKIECILVNDCSTDNSATLCNLFLKSYSGPIDFKYIKRKKNGGLSAARNTGIANALGDYIFFLDSDDEIPINSLELLALEVDKHPGIDVVMGFMYDEHHSNYYDISKFKTFQYIENVSWIQFNSFCLGKNIPVNACNKLLRRSFLIDHNLLFKEGIIHEDNHWMFYVVKNISNLAFVFEPTYIRYWNEGSIMLSKTDKIEAQNWITIMLDFSNHFFEPFLKLQLARYMNLYFANSMYKFHFSNSCLLHNNFLKSCIRQHLWKGALLLIAWIVLYSVYLERLLSHFTKTYSYTLFAIESKRLYEKF